jgi:hypothetical protein
MDNKNMPAMPQPIAANENEFLDTSEYNKDNAGLTKREHFAGLAMQGWLARCANAPQSVKLEPNDMAAVAVSMADALLVELDKVK